jgi:predicted transcriptional regulator
VKNDFDKDKVLNANVRDAVHKHHSILVDNESTVKSVILRMLKYHPYRVCLTEGKDSLDVINVISQSDIIRYIFNNRAVLLPNRDEQLMHLPHLGSKRKVISVKETDSIAEACRLLTKKHVHSIAVVDANGLMKGALTPKSFHNLSPDHWIDFNATIESFEVEGRDPGWVKAETTFEEIMSAVVNHHVHRVFVVSDSQHPAKVITLSDIMHQLIETTEEGRKARQERKKYVENLVKEVL